MMSQPLHYSELRIPPILFIIFKRLDTTKIVFEAIRKAQPQKLYIAADGPKTPEEKEKTDTVRQYVTENIDWNCQVFTHFQEDNLGCRYGVSHAITWFFQHEAEGIILEDDCLPHPDFFKFCGDLLTHYRSEQKVWGICGNNFQDGQHRGPASFYFSHHVYIWGWATWADRWKKYDVDLKNISRFKGLNRKKYSWGEYRYWKNIFTQVKHKKFNTWDYQWMFTMWQNKGLWIVPNKNIVGNIGFGPDATHTFGDQNGIPHKNIETLGEIIYPSTILVNQAADAYAYKTIYRPPPIYRRVWNRIKRLSIKIRSKMLLV